MKRLIILLLPLFLLASAGAEELRSDEYRCTLTLLNTEPWQTGNVQRMPVGEMIFSAANMETKQVVTVIVIPKFPSSNLDTPAALIRFTEILKAQGFEIIKHSPIEWLGLPFIEIVARRLNDATGELVSVTRATIVDKKAYLVSTSGRGDESRMEDERFMRAIKSFRFMDPDDKQVTAPSPYVRYYRAGYIACLVVMLALSAAFAIMYFRTQHRH